MRCAPATINILIIKQPPHRLPVRLSERLINQDSCLCLLDLSKAFDCVPHDKLLIQLSSFGLDHGWFRSYLDNRTQIVRVGNALSDLKPVTCGVSQGSVLGPVFFILYTNGIPATITRSSPDTEVAIYADDTQTVDQGAKLQSMITKAGQNNAAAKQSFASIGLKMNAPKTQAMVCETRQNITHIHTESPPTLNIEGEHLLLDNVVNDLWLLLDVQMSFRPHVDNMVRQMTGTLCYLVR